jgi:hypothetical protein
MNESNKIIRLLVAQNKMLILLLKNAYNITDDEAKTIYNNAFLEAGIQIKKSSKH